jgi:hypothetical protein
MSVPITPALLVALRGLKEKERRKEELIKRCNELFEFQPYEKVKGKAGCKRWQMPKAEVYGLLGVNWYGRVEALEVQEILFYRFGVIAMKEWPRRVDRFAGMRLR